MMEGQEEGGGRTKESIPASRVLWMEALESTIHSVLAGDVSPIVLKDCARAA
jgi:hypothetical protein